MKANESANVPLDGRKRAFSDPGDVKRPATAYTDRRPEALGREDLQNPDRSMSTALALDESSTPWPPPSVSPTYMSSQAPTAAPFALPAYMSPEPSVLYEGLTHGILPGVSRAKTPLSRDSYRMLTHPNVTDPVLHVPQYISPSAFRYREPEILRRASDACRSPDV